MKKRILALALGMMMMLGILAACGDDGSGDATPTPGGSAATPTPGAVPGGTIEDVTLTLWGGEEDQTMLRERSDAFIASVADRVNLTINIGVESEGTAKDTILTDPLAAADVFTFADDQIMELYMAGALQEVLLNAADIATRNVASSVGAATVNGKLYAYPLTADNGYFMFYDSSVFSASDVQSFDKMMEVAAAAGKFVAFEMQGAWYNIAFFRGAGFDAYLDDDGLSTIININEAGGTAVVQAMLDIAANPGFKALNNDEFVTGINDGSVVAGVNGPWNGNNASGAWGENYAAAKLPTFTVGGVQVQMGGVVGHKLVGVNAFSENAGWAMELADFLTNQESQQIRFELRAQGPSNIEASKLPEVQADPAISALGAQAEFSAFFAPGGNYWGPMGTLGEIIVQGNPENIPLQELLDNTVNGIMG
ncbi:MAG: extracellular solute-binding protein [Oscillospiraceae bacterium]|nr:extracellular solute-binding protein [Oscillospiraceae bacterium]